MSKQAKQTLKVSVPHVAIPNGSVHRGLRRRCNDGVHGQDAGPSLQPRRQVGVGVKGVNHAAFQRLRFIDFLLDHYGTLNRRALEDYFGISTPQASLDVQAYLQAAPANAIYDRSRKTYCKAPAFVRQFP